jgi:hypothetical protein
MRFYIPNYDIYQSDSQDGTKGGTAVAGTIGIPHSSVNNSYTGLLHAYWRE